MNAEVRWKKKLAFTGSADSGHEVPLDSSPAVGGDNSGLRPMELMALSLAGCTAMDVISILEKKRQQVMDYQVKVTASRAEDHPKVFTNAVVEYHVAGEEIDEQAVVRSIELSATKYCPSQAMLGKIIPLTLKYYLYEGVDLETAELISQGTYQ